VLEPFLAALRERGATTERQLHLLRRLRLQTHPELTAFCREVAEARRTFVPTDAATQARTEVRELAREILQRAGIAVERPAIEVAGAPLEQWVDARTGLAFIAIPAGEFDMGAAQSEYDNERPVHRVRLSKPFRVGKYPVTNAEYERFLKANPNVKPPPYWTNSQFNDPQQPVVGVSWHDAQAFCQWAGCRLPTEAEWEYACRAGSKGRYCFDGDEAKLEEYAWYYQNSGNKTHPVGQKKPNAWGLYDVHGNVWEWCQDRYGEYPEVPATDPTGPAKGDSRVLRGGSWLNSLATSLRCAYRDYRTPDYRYYYIGFRCVWLGGSSP
jgi:formylglycine-generating enzyme required for sulfatase activity